ncbi:MAG: MarR family transcriptional regulator [Candidatus Hydrogenedentota bacterium]
MADKNFARKPAPTDKGAPLDVVSSGVQETIDFDRVIYEKYRLAIVSALAVNASLSFNELKRILGTSDGNLSTHARKLEDAGYIACKKFFEDRTPKTEYELTSKGRSALERYLSQMESLIQRVREG